MSCRERFSQAQSTPKPTLLSQDEAIRCVVTKLLRADRSPEQVAGWLKRHSSDGKAMCISQNDLQISVYLNSWRTAPGVEETLAHQEDVSSRQVPPSCRQRRHRRCDFYSRTLCTGGRQGPAWTLGRRPAGRLE